jgi:hypothetical protein
MKIKDPLLLRLLHYFVLLLILSARGYSQDAGSCAEKLKTAQSLFDKGQVDQVPSMLYECMKSGFNREESLSAYKLLIQAYLFEEKLELADSTMLTFLKKNPEYKISPTDHSSFVNLYNNFIVKPVVQLTFHILTNVPFITFINTFNVSGMPGSSKYSVKLINLFASGEAKFELTKKIELNFELGYSQLAFSNVKSFNNLDNISIYNSNTTETHKRIEIPVSLTYNFKNFGKFTPYGRFGFGTAFSLGSSVKVSAIAVDRNNTINHTGPDISRKDSRISMDLFSQIGGGLKYKIKGGYFIAELRTNLGFLNQTVRGKAVAEVPEQELRVNFYNADDDFHLNALNFTLGYTRIFYKPSKRKE